MIRTLAAIFLALAAFGAQAAPPAGAMVSWFECAPVGAFNVFCPNRSNFCHRHTVPEMEPLDCFSLQPESGLPDAHRLTVAATLNKYVPSSVASLLLFGSPSNIPWLIATIHVNSVNASGIVRRATDVREKRDEISFPFRADGNASSSISRVTRGFRVATTPYNTDPASVFLGRAGRADAGRFSMLDRPRAYAFDDKASTALRGRTTQMDTPDQRFLPAVAPAFPARRTLTTRADVWWAKGQNGQPPKSLAGHINKMRFIHAGIIAVKYDGPVDNSIARWYRGLRQPGTGLGCCSEADCRQTHARHTDAGWEAQTPDGEWVPVPPSLVLEEEAHPGGSAVLCWLPTRGVMCFVPPMAGG